MRRMMGLAVTIGMIALLPACGDRSAGGTTSAAPQASGNAAAPATGDAAPAPAAPATADTATPQATGDAGGYAAYIGKYAFDEVNGARLLARPEVVSAVRAALGDDRIYRDISTTQGGPSTPIYMRAGKIGTWSCEQHNCGDHQWTVLFDPATKSAEVCYHNAQTTGEGSRWYSAGHATTREGGCPSE